MSKIKNSIFTIFLVLLMLLLALPEANAYEITREPEMAFINLDEDITLKEDNPISTNENPMIESKELFIDGVSFGKYLSEDVINKSILSIANRYLNDQKTETINVLDNIEIVDGISVLSTIDNKETLVGNLLDTENLQDLQVQIKQGDGLEEFLDKYLLTKEELLSSNEELENYISQEEVEDTNKEVFNQDLQINLSLPTPRIDIEISEEIQRDIVVENTTEYKDSSSMYKGKEKVEVEGNNGLNRETVRLSSINGIDNPEEILDTQLIEETVNRVILVGTKERGRALGYFIRPTTGYVSSPYGYRSRGFHGGIDFANSYGTSIIAADGGVVTETGWDGTYGKKVTIDHRNGYKTIYAHCSSINVSVGDYVNQGELIARMGSTGNSTGNHLHFEIRINNKRVNPSNYI